LHYQLSSLNCAVLSGADREANAMGDERGEDYFKHLR
jgi:hypothetical protein